MRTLLNHFLHIVQERADSNVHGELLKSSRQQHTLEKKEHNEKVNEPMEVSILNQKRKRNENTDQNNKTNKEETQKCSFVQDATF